MGKRIRIKIITHGRYVRTSSFESLYFIKNKTDKIKKRKTPSDLTIVQKDVRANEKSIAFCSYFRKRTKEETPSKINSGSVIPKNELSKILGSNVKRDAPIRDIFSSKNFLHKKYTGITVRLDKIIEIIRCNCMYCKVFPRSIIENQNEINIDQPLLIGVQSVGKCPYETISVAYVK